MLYGKKIGSNTLKKFTAQLVNHVERSFWCKSIRNIKLQQTLPIIPFESPKNETKWGGNN